MKFVQMISQLFYTARLCSVILIIYSEPLFLWVIIAIGCARDISRENMFLCFNVSWIVSHSCRLYHDKKDRNMRFSKTFSVCSKMFDQGFQSTVTKFLYLKFFQHRRGHLSMANGIFQACKRLVRHHSRL